MITNHDRSGWIGASDVQYVLGSWKGKTFERWWREKLGLRGKKFENESMLAGTNWEHKVLESLPVQGMTLDRQILMPEILLRVNLDGNTTGHIYECKTYKIGGASSDIRAMTRGEVPTRYRNQIQVQMYASKIYEAYLVAYGLVTEDYSNFFRAVDPGRRQLIPVDYDPKWVEETYLPRHRILSECLKRRCWPDV